MEENSGLLESMLSGVCSNHALEICELETKQDAVTAEDFLRMLNNFSETSLESILRQTSTFKDDVKNETRANKYREEGNQAYLSKKFNEALNLYSMAVRYAPANSDTNVLALSYANRSAVLVQMKLFEDALKDCNTALSSGYPQHLQFKIYERKMKCFMAMEDLISFKEAQSSFKTSLGVSKLSDKQKEEHLNVAFAIKPSTKPRMASKAEYPKKRLKLKDPSKLFPSFSSAIKIRYGKENGRYGVAARDIQLGELICVEEPETFFLDFSKTGSHCSHCFRYVLSSIASPISTQEIFCSEECLSSAISSYHTIESRCSHILRNLGLKKKEWYLAFRAVSSRPLQFFLEHKEKLEEHNPHLGVGEDFVYSSHDFFTLYNLVRHSSSWSFSENLYKSLAAFVFAQCLQYAGYFEDQQSQQNESETSSSELTDSKLLVAKVLVNLMEVATMNCHAIGQLEIENKDAWLLGNTAPIGCALEPTMVLLNHACEPSFLRVNFGAATYGFACKFIKKGSEIFDSYTNPYDIDGKIERQKFLSNKYKFTCKCVPCRNNWGLFNEIPRSLGDVPQENLKIPLEDLLSSSGKSKMKSIQDIGARIHKLQTAQDIKGVIGLYPLFEEALKDVIAPPHQYYVIARRSLASCLWMQFGNVWIKK